MPADPLMCRIARGPVSAGEKEFKAVGRYLHFECEKKFTSVRMTLAEILGPPAKWWRYSAAKGRVVNWQTASQALRHRRDYDNTGAIGNFALVTSSS